MLMDCYAYVHNRESRSETQSVNTPIRIGCALIDLDCRYALNPAVV